MHCMKVCGVGWENDIAHDSDIESKIEKRSAILISLFPSVFGNRFIGIRAFV